MAEKLTLNTQILVRRGLAANLEKRALASGEFGYATDRNVIKMGDGSTAFSTLKTIAYTDDITTAIDAAIKSLNVEAKGTTTASPAATVTGITVSDAGVFTVTYEPIQIAQDQVTGLGDALSDKADKVTGATAGNFAGLDANGNLTDSGKKADDFANKTHTHAVGDVLFTDAQLAAINSGIKSADVTKLANIEAGAEVNIIETVKVNGTALTPDADRAVNVVIPAAAEYSIEKLATTTAGASASYQLTKDGAKVGAVIDIPKDMVVSSGAVVTDPAGQPAGTYIELTLANATSDKLYINVGDLIEYVTSGSAAEDMVVINVSADHKVTATITDGKVTLAKLDADTQAKINQAHTHANIAELNKIVAGDKEKWDIAAGKAHEHDNKALLDTYDQTNANIKDAVAKKHSHSFTDNDVTDAISKKHEHANKAVLDGITAEMVTDWNSDDNTTYKVAPTANALEFTVTPVNGGTEGAAETVKLVAPTVDVGVTKVTAGTDITVTPAAGTGDVTVAHKAYTTGTVEIKDAKGNTPEVPYFLNALTLTNGHVTGANAQSLAEALQALTLVLDGGNADEE